IDRMVTRYWHPRGGLNVGSEPQSHVEAPKRLFRLSADADRLAATCSRSSHRGRNRTLRDSMSVPQLVFLPRAVIAGNAAIFSPRWTLTASYPKVSQIAAVPAAGLWCVPDNRSSRIIGRSRAMVVHFALAALHVGLHETHARQTHFVKRADLNIIGLDVAEPEVTSLQAA